MHSSRQRRLGAESRRREGRLVGEPFTIRNGPSTLPQPCAAIVAVMNRTRKLWLVFDGGPVTGRPVRAHLEAPSRGPWLRVTVAERALAAGTVSLLVRKGLGD